MTMPQDDLKAFTRNPLLAILSTVNPNGTPQSTPVWYEYDGEAFIVTSFADRIKVRNIRRNPAVSLVVMDTVSYGEPLTVNGTAELIEEGAQEATLRGAIRYQGEELGKISAAHMAGRPRMIIRIKPARVLFDAGRGMPIGPTETREDITG